MKNIKKLAALLILASTFALPSIAGEMPIGGIFNPPPPPDPPPSGAQSTTATVDPLTGILLDLLTALGPILP